MVAAQSRSDLHGACLMDSQYAGIGINFRDRSIIYAVGNLACLSAARLSSGVALTIGDSLFVNAKGKAGLLQGNTVGVNRNGNCLLIDIVAIPAKPPNIIQILAGIDEALQIFCSNEAPHTQIAVAFGHKGFHLCAVKSTTGPALIDGLAHVDAVRSDDLDADPPTVLRTANGYILCNPFQSCLVDQYHCIIGAAAGNRTAGEGVHFSISRLDHQGIDVLCLCILGVAGSHSLNLNGASLQNGQLTGLRIDLRNIVSGNNGISDFTSCVLGSCSKLVAVGTEGNFICFLLEAKAFLCRLNHIIAISVINDLVVIGAEIADIGAEAAAGNGVICCYGVIVVFFDITKVTGRNLQLYAALVVTIALIALYKDTVYGYILAVASNGGIHIRLIVKIIGIVGDGVDRVLSGSNLGCAPQGQSTTVIDGIKGQRTRLQINIVQE